MLPTDEQAVKVLAYPTCDRRSYLRVLRDLESIGVEMLIPYGNADLDGIKVLGKGCVGIVLKGLLKGETVALKVLRADANRASLMDEGCLLSLANGCRVGPKLIATTESVLALEYIDGKYLVKWLAESRTATEVCSVLKELLTQARCLDEIGLDHGELSDAKKHILVDSRGKPCILDFETASRNRRQRNLVSIVGYLFFKGSVSSLTEQYLSWNRGTLMGLLKDYKNSPTEKKYEEILVQLGLP